MINTAVIGKLSEFDAYHEKAASTLMETCNNFPYLLHGGSSEVGEVSGIWAKSIRTDYKLIGPKASQDKIRALKLELGDVFYFVDALAILVYGITLGTLLKKHYYVTTPFSVSQDYEDSDDITVIIPARSFRSGKRRPSVKRIDADFSKLENAFAALKSRIERRSREKNFNKLLGPMARAFVAVVIAIDNLCMDFGTSIREIQLMNNEKLLNRRATNNIMGDGDHRGEKSICGQCAAGDYPTVADPDPQGRKKPEVTIAEMIGPAKLTSMSKSL